VKMLTREVTVKTPSNQVCVICLKTIGADPSFITPCVSKTICSDCYKAIDSYNGEKIRQTKSSAENVAKDTLYMLQKKASGNN